MATLQGKFKARNYQLKINNAFDNGYRRLIQIWHRRAGKDITDLNIVIAEMLQNVGNYYYTFPTYSQGKKALWEGRGKDGMKYLDYFREDLVKSKNEQEMKISFKNGSLFQIVGVEDPDTIVGTNPRGIVFSEYSLQNPVAWDLMRPILKENGGWAIFNATPRGKNHFYKLYEMAKNNPRWFVEKLTIDDTGVLNEEDMEEEREEGMTEEMIQQEYYCSFLSAIQGAIYWEQLNTAEKNKQFTDVAYDPLIRVHTVWDLGKNDTNCIGFYQTNGITWRKIDYLEGNKKGLPDWIKLVLEKPYNYGKHFAPHDIKVSDYSLTGVQSRLDVAKKLGLKFEIVPNIPIQDGINAGRMFFSKLYIDKTKCAKFLEAIPQYSRKYDEKKKVLLDEPMHDWTSHYADEHRYAAIVHDLMSNENPKFRYNVFKIEEEKDKINPAL